MGKSGFREGEKRADLHLLIKKAILDDCTILEHFL